MTLKGTIANFWKGYDWVGHQLDRLKYAGVIATAILAITHFKTCSNKDAMESSLKSIIEAQSAKLMSYKGQNDVLVSQISAARIDAETFQSVVKENQQLKDALTNAKIKASQVTSVTTMVSKTAPPPVYIPYPVHDTIKVPDGHDIPFSKDTATYSIAGLIGSKGIHLNKVVFPDSLTLVVGDKKKGLFAKPQFVITATHSNPFVKTTGLSNMTITPARKWYNNPWLKIGIGAAAGIFVAHELHL